MILDRQIAVSKGQAVTAVGSTVSTDVIDLGSSRRDIGRAEQMRLYVAVDQTFTSAGAATLLAQWVESDNADLSSPVVLVQSNGGVPLALTDLTAGAVLIDTPVPATRRRYLGMIYVVAGAAMTGGTIGAGLLKTTPTPISQRPTGSNGYTPEGGGSGLGFVNRLAVRPPVSSSAGLVTFDTWYGKAADFVTVFNSHTNWTSFLASVDEVIANYAGDTRPKIWTTGPNVTGTTLASAAAGDFDGYYTTMAQKVAADAPASGFILVRVGHEFNLAGTYPWEVINSGAATAFRAAFRRMVDRFRAVSNRFRFIWNPNWISTGAGGPSFDVTTCYPGNDYVDALGQDLYYNGNIDDPSPDVAFNYAKNLAGYGLQAQANLGASYGKPLVMCEFGLNWDKPKWVDLMWSWMTSQKFAYAGYFDANPDFNWQLSGGAYPDSGARFKADFRDGGPVPMENWTFTYGSEGFTASGATTFSVVSGVAQVTGGANFTDRAGRNLDPSEVGRSYRVELDLNTGGKNARIAIVENASPFNTIGILTVSTATLERKSFTFIASQTSLSFRVIPYAADAAQVVKFDNIQRFPL